MDADSLSMTEDEFKRYMSGEIVPHDPTRQYSCEGLHLMHQNLQTLTELNGRHEKLMAEALQLQQEMNDFKESFSKQIEDVINDTICSHAGSGDLERTPLIIKPRKLRVDIDEENSEAERLPSPLTPEVVGLPADEEG